MTDIENEATTAPAPLDDDRVEESVVAPAEDGAESSDQDSDQDQDSDEDSDEVGGQDRRGGSADDLEDRLVAEGEIAGDYLEELLDLLDFDGDIDLDVEGIARSSVSTAAAI